MDELLLIEAIERYVNGDMQQEEKQHFEALRNANSDMDQFVVNHLAFLQQIDKLADRKHLATTLDAVHADLVSTHQIDIDAPHEAKVIPFWTGLKKKLAVAATIAALVTLSAMGIIFAYNKSKSDSGLIDVNKKFNTKISELERKVDEMESSTKATKRPFVEASSNGTGFIVNEAGYLVTAYHVVKDAKEIYAYNETYGDLKVDIMVKDEANDVAVLKIADTSFKVSGKIPYSLKFEQIGLAQQVYTMGYCRPPYLTYNEGTVASRAANNKAKQNGFLLSLQVDGGNSGSPIFNKNGQIIGIVAAKEQQENGFSFGVKLSGLEPSIKVLKEQKMVTVALNNNYLSGTSIERQTKRVEPFIFMVKTK